MSVSAVGSLRPLQGQCLRNARTGLLSIHIKSRSANMTMQALVMLRPEQRRFQSDSTSNKSDPNSRSEAPRPPRPEKLTARQFFGRAMTSAMRNFAYLASPKGFKQSLRDSPVSTTLLAVMLIILFGLSAVQLKLFYETFYNPRISRYPEPLATTLRRAIYYTTISPDPDKALKCYRNAMAEAKELGMDPASDEVLGIRIMVAFWMEKNDNFSQSTEVLESVRTHCLEWVDEIEKKIKDGKVDADGMLKEEPAPAAQPAPSAEATALEKKPEGEEKTEQETQWRRRERLLRTAVSTSVKLGELYASQYVMDPDNSHRHLVWSVETTLKEFRRRREEGPKPGEDKWMTPTEVGATMESLGRDYERKSQFHLAIPLFFHGLRNCESPCHRAVIMNNLSACFAQHPIYSPANGGNEVSPETQSLKDLFDSSMPNTRKDCLEAAANWARNAYTHAKDVKGDDRTDECDEACAVALCNWGDVAAMQGKTELAKKKYTQCIEMSNKLEFKQGVRQAQKGLKNLNTAASKK